jgi:hypothetical protein
MLLRHVQKLVIHSSTCQISTYHPHEFIIRTIATQKTTNLQFKGKHFPVVSAQAITINKSQGATHSTTFVHLKTKMLRSQLYVACSRVTSASGLFIVGNFCFPAPPANIDSVAPEIRWLQQSLFVPEFSSLYEPKRPLQLIFHIVQSLRCHFQNIFRTECQVR